MIRLLVVVLVLLLSATGLVQEAGSCVVWIMWTEEITLVPTPQPPVWTVHGARSSGDQYDCPMEMFISRDVLIPRPGESGATTSGSSSYFKGGKVFRDAANPPVRQIRTLCLPASIDPRPKGKE